jgi:hypothetical protein
MDSGKLIPNKLSKKSVRWNNTLGINEEGIDDEAVNIRAFSRLWRMSESN